MKVGGSGMNFKNSKGDRERFEGMFRDGGTDTIKGELAGLPDFLTEDPEVRQQVIDWQVDWIEKSTTPNGKILNLFLSFKRNENRDK